MSLAKNPKLNEAEILYLHIERVLDGLYQHFRQVHHFQAQDLKTAHAATRKLGAIIRGDLPNSTHGRSIGYQPTFTTGQRNFNRKAWLYDIKTPDNVKRSCPICNQSRKVTPYVGHHTAKSEEKES